MGLIMLPTNLNGSDKHRIYGNKKDDKYNIKIYGISHNNIRPYNLKNINNLTQNILQE